ncbi:hypothetical protein M501DRAFT_1061069 [Patellaria atrata CBS 101060]|uniref:Protein kinase domain-containing protein n=1 Tax=Patellaria atrata CBS 101060 TaxID=1346257 RepID=A0A9P4S350_9PEZI|nr:hypothetical protein M501DRAFT_1061069 [Patellaria atrata CBS 101060]
MSAKQRLYLQFPASSFFETGKMSFAMDGVFNRHPRPQAAYLPVPTKAALLTQNIMKDKPHDGLVTLEKPKPIKSRLSYPTRLIDSHRPNTNVQTITIEQKFPSDILTRMGTLTQGQKLWMVCRCITPKHSGELIMFKDCKPGEASREIGILKKLSHPNIVQLKQAFIHQNICYVGITYLRFTLREILYVHMSLGELQVKYLAKEVFQGLQYLHEKKCTYTGLNLDSVRIDGKKGNVVLEGFSQAFLDDDDADADEHGTYIMNSHDSLQDLGFILLECMEGRPAETKRDIDFIKKQREQYKVFGLHNAEAWSGCKQLIDFLDELFNVDKEFTAKIQRPHEFIKEDGVGPSCLMHYLELVSLECFTEWQAYIA